MRCGICNCPVVPPSGPEDSPILLVGAYPGNDELNQLKPWVGPAGKVLRRELIRAGLDFNRCRVTNLWLHSKSNDIEEKDWHLRQLKKEMKGRKFFLLMGADVCELFTGGKISEYEGIRIDSELLPDSTKCAIIMRNPASATLRRGTIGEIRFILRTFVEEVKPCLNSWRNSNFSTP